MGVLPATPDAGHAAEAFVMNHSSIGHAGAHRHSNLARRSTPATALHRNLVLTHLRLGRVHRIEQSEQNYPHRLVLHALALSRRKPLRTIPAEFIVAQHPIAREDSAR